MYTRVFVVTFVAFFVQFSQYSAAQSFQSSSDTELNQFDIDVSETGLNSTEDAHDTSGIQQADTVSATLFESSLSSSPLDLARQSNAQQRVVYSALQFVALGLLLLVGAVVGALFYTRRNVADQFGTPTERRRDNW